MGYLPPHLLQESCKTRFLGYARLDWSVCGIDKQSPIASQRDIVVHNYSKFQNLCLNIFSKRIKIKKMVSLGQQSRVLYVPIEKNGCTEWSSN